MGNDGHQQLQTPRVKTLRIPRNLRKVAKMSHESSGTHVPEPTAREPAPAVSAHTRPVSSENTVSTFAVNASVRRPPILDLSSTVKVPQWHGTLRSICA